MDSNWPDDWDKYLEDFADSARQWLITQERDLWETATVSEWDTIKEWPECQ